MDIKRSPEEEMPPKLKPLEEYVQEAMFEGRIPSPAREVSAQYDMIPQTPNSAKFMERRRASGPGATYETRISDIQSKISVTQKTGRSERMQSENLSLSFRQSPRGARVSTPWSKFTPLVATVSR